MMSKGKYRVGYKFNPSNSSMVEEIKLRAADLIDLIDGIIGVQTAMDDLRGKEISRLKALAQTAIEDGAMWAVKAATKGPME